MKDLTPEFEAELRDKIYKLFTFAKNEMSPEDYKNFKEVCLNALTVTSDIGQSLLLIDEVVRPYVNIKRDLNDLLPQRFKYDQTTAKNEVYFQFISTLKRHEHKEISMDEMNRIIEELLMPFPPLQQKFQRFLQMDRVLLIPYQSKFQDSKDYLDANNQFQNGERQDQSQNIQKGKKITKKLEGEKVAPIQTKPNQRGGVFKPQAIQKGAMSQVGDDQSDYSVVTQTKTTIIQESKFGNNQRGQVTPVLGIFQNQLKHLPKTEYSFFENLRKSIKDESFFDDIMKCFFCYIEGIFNQSELFDLISPLFDKSNEDLLHLFRTIVASRDNTRRHHNLLCKPFSEFDTSHFKKLSYSYFEMPPEFPKPLCQGRSKPDIRALCKEVFNEEFSSLPQGSESFKFKTKNQYEDALFKVEDDIYKIDFDIGNIYKTMKVLEEEKAKISALNDAEQAEFKLDPRKFNKLRLKQIEKIYGDLGQEILRLLPISPAKAIPIIYDRFKNSYEKNVQEKQEYIKNWRDQCEKNFMKSLDHRSFHFKSFEKKNQSSKNYILELKNLGQQSFKSKNLNQMLVHSKELTENENLCTDHPINMDCSKEVLQANSDKLPHMRFLFNNKEILDLTLQMILVGIRLANNGGAEKEKMRQSLRAILEEFMEVQNFEDILRESKEIIYLEESQVDYICQRDYYEGKVKEDFQYERIQTKAQDEMMDEEKKDSDVKQGDQNGSDQGNQLSPETAKQINKGNSINQSLKPLNLQSYSKDEVNLVQNSPFYPYHKPEYRLLYGSQNFYVILRQIYTIYERLMKAHQLVADKVQDDMNSRNDDNLKKRIDEFRKERFEVFLGGILVAMQSGADFNKYEDFARALLGSKAYLLFSFDKLIVSTVKQLLNISNDDSCQKSLKLYLKFKQNADICLKQKTDQSELWYNEPTYLSNFSTCMQQFSSFTNINREINNFNGYGIQPQTYKLYFESETQDVLIYKRKTKLKLEEEFLLDFKVRVKTEEIKRRHLESQCTDRSSDRQQQMMESD
ncbi:paired amphipathic helix protein sin3a-like [Stylonychia lemnae]|uniref:Paired amphipathic helix protein sin3a-like n=1 Tax=Stylonychia lemnae TaxID=5949 RepID=A0A077ZUZ6_STYLE|nr:paired amphipathic helix protein sin3a-like [Stylonychia lemnae]|eukprot:CDW73125.1 paired amphipathic helix protein sin3a-like [Stylonychia lemnae]